MSAAEVMLVLFDNTVLARSRSAFALDVLTMSVRGTTGLASARPEADQTVAAILDAIRPPRD